MLLADLLRDYTTGDQGDWIEERTYLEQIHAEHLAELRVSVARDGIREPVRLCRTEMRIIDGHHRILVAEDLGLREIPVADAWAAPTTERANGRSA